MRLDQRFHRRSNRSLANHLGRKLKVLDLCFAIELYVCNYIACKVLLEEKLILRQEPAFDDSVKLLLVDAKSVFVEDFEQQSRGRGDLYDGYVVTQGDILLRITPSDVASSFWNHPFMPLVPLRTIFEQKVLHRHRQALCHGSNVSLHLGPLAIVVSLRIILCL